MAKFVVNFVEGGLMALMLTLWVGLDFLSWQFWGPFMAWAFVSGIFDGLRREFT